MKGSHLIMIRSFFIVLLHTCLLVQFAAHLPLSKADPIQPGGESWHLQVNVAIPDALRPWEVAKSEPRSGTVVGLDGGWFITAAHIVRFGTDIVATQPGNRRIRLSLVACDPGLDLAILRGDDLPIDAVLAPLANTFDMDVGSAVSIPSRAGADSGLTLRSGTISSLTLGRYYAGVAAPQFEVTGAGELGLSGSACLRDSAVIGLIVAARSNGVGIVIPSPVIALALRQLQMTGSFTGLWTLHDLVQDSASIELRQAMRINDSERGVFVRRAHGGIGCCEGSGLHELDFISHIDGRAVSDSGMVMTSSKRQMNLLWQVAESADVNGRFSARVIRDGVAHELVLQATREKCMVVPYFDDSARFVPFGPFILVEANQSIPQALTQQATEMRRWYGNPMITRRFDSPAFPNERIVIVAENLAARLMPSHQDLADVAIGSALKSVNGVEVRNLEHLAELAATKEKTVNMWIIEFFDDDIPVVALDVDHVGEFSKIDVAPSPAKP